MDRHALLRSLALGGAALIASSCGLGRAPVLRMADRDARPAIRLDEGVDLQLRGHLARARGCWEDARHRRPALAGVAVVELRIPTSGHASDARVLAEEGLGGAVVDCMRERLSGLFFDPAPERRARVVRHAFVLCPPGADGVCEVHPALREGGDPDRPSPIDDAVTVALRAGVHEMRACAGDLGRDGVLVTLEVGVTADRRIMSGRIADTIPSDASARRCRLGPLLGTALPGLPDRAIEPARYRYSFVLR